MPCGSRMAASPPRIVTDPDRIPAPFAAELQGSEREESFRLIAETAANAIYIHDGKRLVYVNRAAELITGYTREELLAGDMWHLVHPEDLGFVRDNAVKRFRGEPAPPRYEYRILHKSGAIRWLDFSGGLVQFAGCTCVLATAFDITDRKNAEAELRTSEERLRLAQATANMGSWEWNIQTGEVIWSPEMALAHGMTLEQFDGTLQGFEARLHPEDRERVFAAVEAAVERDADYDIEFRVIWPDGSLHWQVARGKVFRDTGGRPLRMVGIGMDITERKQAEAALRLSEKMAAIGRLAATIAHEINNPLEAVTNIVYLLRTNPSLDPQAAAFVAMAEKELDRVAQITRQTLAFYRDSNQPVPVRLTHLLDDVAEVYSRRIASKGIALRKDWEFDGAIEVFPGEMRQVFANLLLNAIEAAPERGAIRIRVRPADLADSHVRVTISDNGPGINAEDRRHIFDPFFTTKSEKGTGLGLWVSRGIVQKHRGSMRFRSATSGERRGTTFTLTLPARAAGHLARGAA
jgi:PAS domain S-box-containing protein